MPSKRTYAAGPTAGPAWQARRRMCADVSRLVDKTRIAARMKDEAACKDALKALADRLDKACADTENQLIPDGAALSQGAQRAIGTAFGLDDVHPDVVRAINDVGMTGLAMDALTRAAKALDQADYACEPIVEAELAHPHDEGYKGVGMPDGGPFDAALVLDAMNLMDGDERAAFQDRMNDEEREAVAREMAYRAVKRVADDVKRRARHEAEAPDARPDLTPEQIGSIDI